jgi:hypothetical protein
MFDAEYNGTYMALTGHWLIQFKLRRAVERSKSYKTLSKLVKDHLREMSRRRIGADIILFVTNLRLNKNEIDKVESLSTLPKLLVWEGAKLESFMAKYPVLPLHYFDRAIELSTSFDELCVALAGGLLSIFSRSEATTVANIVEHKRLTIIEGYPLSGKTCLLLEVGRRWISQGKPVVVLRAMNPAVALQLRYSPDTLCVVDDLEFWESPPHALLDLPRVLAACRTVMLGGRDALIKFKDIVSRRSDSEWFDLRTFREFDSFIHSRLPADLPHVDITKKSIALMSTVGDIPLPGVVDLISNSVDLYSATPNEILCGPPPGGDQFPRMIADITARLSEPQRKLMKSFKIANVLLFQAGPYAKLNRFELETMHRAVYGEYPDIEDMEQRGLFRVANEIVSFWSQWHLELALSISYAELEDAATKWFNYSISEIDRLVGQKLTLYTTKICCWHLFIVSRHQLVTMGYVDSFRGLLTLYREVEWLQPDLPPIQSLLENRCWICLGMRFQDTEVVNRIFAELRAHEVLVNAFKKSLAIHLYMHAVLGDVQHLRWVSENVDRDLLEPRLRVVFGRKHSRLYRVRTRLRLQHIREDSCVESPVPVHVVFVCCGS